MAKAKAEDNGELSKQSISQLADIDWDLAYLAMEAKCTGEEVADIFGVHRKTIYNRAERDLGCTYSTISRQKRSKGIAMLKIAGYLAARKAEDDPKFIAALIFQLKARCGMSDRPKEDKGTGVVNITVNKGDESNA